MNIADGDWRQRGVVSVKVAAEILGLSRNAAYEGIKQGDIPSLKIGRWIIVPVARLRIMLGEANEAEATR